MRLAKVTDTLRGLARYVVLAASTALVACGGPGGTAPTTTPSPSIAVAISSATINAATPATVAVKLVGGDNKPISGARVTFTTDSSVGLLTPGVVNSTDGTITGSALTDVDGAASVQIKAGPSAGVGTVVVTYDPGATSGGSGAGTTTVSQPITARVNYTSTGGGVRPSSIVITSTNSIVDTATTATFSALVLGADGRPISGAKVTFTTDSNFGVLEPGTISVTDGSSVGTSVTGANGIAIIRMTAGPSAGAGTVTATYLPASASAGAFVGEFNFTSRGGGTKPTTRVDVRISNSNVDSTVPVTVTATLVRTDGGSISGQKITFSTNSAFGLLSPGSVIAANSTSSGSTLTDSSGVATIALNAGPGIGAETVTATFIPTVSGASTSVGSIQGSVNYTSRGGGATSTTRILLSLSSSTVNSAIPTTVTARLTRPDGGSVSGQRIQFSSNSNFGAFSLGAIDSTGTSTVGGLTDAAGVASVQILSGPQAGVDTITATFTPLTSGTSSGLSGVSDQINYSSSGGGLRPSSLSLSIDQPNLTATSLSTVTARLVGADNRPVSNATISFSAPSTLGVFVPASGVAQTNADGIAQIQIRAGAQAGPGAITASFTSSSGAAAITANLAFGSSGGAAAAATSIRVTIDSVNITPSVSTTIRATLLNANNQPVPNTKITFTTDNNFGVFTPASGTALTDAVGVATIQIRAGALQGAGTVFAASDPLTDGTVGRGSVGYSGSGGGGNVDTGVEATSLQLLVSSGTLLADGFSEVVLTALVKDANNNTLSGKRVAFSSDAGAITLDPASSGMTGANGQISATLSTLGDKTSRTITVTATQGNLVARNTVQVTGSKVTVSGVSSLVLGATTPITIRVQDGAGKPVSSQLVTLTSNLRNIFARADGTAVTSVVTDTTGQATVTYRAAMSGNDTITASALGESGLLPINVSGDQFTIEVSPSSGSPFRACSPTTPTEVVLNTAASIRVNYQQNGVAQSGAVGFSTTRGALSASQATLSGGQAMINVQANTAGGGVVTATSGSVSAQCALEFVATVPFRLVLQADSAVVSPKGKTTITATVRDAADNLVKNQTVVFTLVDATGGTLSVAQGITDSFGQTSTTYTAGNSASAKDAVQISAAISNQTLTLNNSPLRLTVAGQSLFVKVGTGNTVAQLNPTVNQLPYSVIVTDAAGNAVNGAQVTLTLQSTFYRKGFYIYNGIVHIPVGGFSDYTVPAGMACNAGDFNLVLSTATTEGSCRSFNTSPIVCGSEDVNNNGQLDTGEDVNSNSQLDPGFVATVPPTAVTDATGTALVQISYPKDRSGWVGVRLIARATVQGTEGTGDASFILPGLASEYTTASVSPPGAISPYGTVQNCSSAL